MGKEARLIKNTLILFIGVVGTRLISFVMLPLYTSWLSVEEYGMVDIFTTIVSMCVPLLTLQLEQAVFRFMIEDKVLQEYQETVSTGVMCLLVVLLCVDIPAGVILILNGNRLNILYLVAINLQSLYVMVQQIVRGKGQNHIYTENSILLASVNVFFSVLFIRVCRLGVGGYVLAFCLAHIVAICFMVAKSKIYYLIRISAVQRMKLKKMLAYSFPMIINNVSWWILNASDKLLINFFIGTEANGIYAAAGKLPGLVTTVYTVFQMAWQESTSREQGKNISVFYSNVFRKLFALMSYFVIGMLLCGRILFKSLISDKFEMAYNHIPILVLALLFLCISQFYGGIYVGIKKSGELGWTSAIAAVVNLVVNLVCIKKIGIYAASISTLAAYALLCEIRFVSSKKICNIRYRIKEILITTIMLMVAFAMAYSSNVLLQLSVLLVVTGGYWVLYKDILRDLINMIYLRINFHR